MLNFVSYQIAFFKKLLPNYLWNQPSQNFEIELETVNKYFQFVCFWLKKHCLSQQSHLNDINVVDLSAKKKQFSLYYILSSSKFNNRVSIKLQINQMSSICSICMLFPSANWLEREIWDMFGIFFNSHPDLRRILTDYGFKGHPLLKTFPLGGFSELYFSDTRNSIVSANVEFTQAYRWFYSLKTTTKNVV